MIKRRKFISGAATAGVGAATVALSAPSLSQGRIEWKMVTSWPRGLPGLATGADRIAQRIGEMSDGRLTVRVFHAGELVPALQGVDAVSAGTAEMGHDASYYHIGKSPGFQFWTCVPFGFIASEQTGWVNHGGGQALWDELYDRYGIQGWLGGNTNAQAFGWFRREITGVESFRGLKYRMPGWGGQILSRLGTTVVVLPGGEIFAALQSGAVDAAEWVGPYNDLALGFHQVAKICYSPGYHEPGSSLQCYVNKSRYSALPNDLKMIVKTAIQWGHDDTTGEFMAKSAEAMEILRTQHGVRFLVLPRDVLIAIGNAAGEFLAETRERADPLVKRIFDSYLNYRKQMVQYTRWADATMLNARVLPYRYFDQGQN